MVLNQAKSLFTTGFAPYRRPKGIISAQYLQQVLTQYIIMNTTEEDKKLRDLQEKAVDACITHYTRHGGYFQMANAVEVYMAAEVGYKGNPSFVIGHRQIAA